MSLFNRKCSRKFVASCRGYDLEPQFVGRYAMDGSVVLVYTGDVDLKKEINSHKAECDLDYILSLLAVGDTSRLNHSTPLYGDFTNLPTSYADVLNCYRAGVDSFSKLNKDVRSAYGNDMAKWFADIGSDKWNSLMYGDKAEDVNPEIQVDVKE